MGEERQIFTHQDGNNWIGTFTGRKFYPMNPQPDDICIEDIAHALSNTCRYNGHCRTFYSVAQHSWHMSYLNQEHARWLLLHDAAEAYISDVPTPVKPLLRDFGPMEEKILAAIQLRFGLDDPDHDIIKKCDLIMLATEKRDVVTHGYQWSRNDLPEPLQGNIEPLHPYLAEQLFLERAEKLGLK